MNADQLRTLTAVVAEGSFEHAALELGISQSAVSQRIKALESSIGRPVVQRSSPVVPTPIGQSLLRHAKALELLESELDSELERQRHSDALEIAANAETLSIWFAEALALASERTGRSFTVVRDDEGHTAQRLKTSGTIVAAVSAQSQPAQGCVATALGAIEYRAVASPTFVERWGLTHSLDGLGAAPVMQFDQKDSMQLAFLADQGQQCTGKQHFYPSSSGFAAAIAAGMGWGLVPVQQIAGLPAGAVVPLNDAIIRVDLYWHVWRIDASVLTELTDSVREIARSRLAPPRAE